MLEAVDDVKQARLGVALIGGAFAIACLIGYLGVSPYASIAPALEDIGERLASSRFVVRWLIIFLHNAFVAYISVRLTMLWGLIPAALAVVNGLAIGGAIQAHPPLLEALRRIAPHGVFEIPASLIAWGFGLSRGLSWYPIRAQSEILDEAEAANRVFLHLVVPLLAAAAFIEAQ